MMRHLDSRTQITLICNAITSTTNVTLSLFPCWPRHLQLTLCGTTVDGVMSAEGLLDNPAIFSTTDHNKNRLELALEYLSLVDKYPVKMKSVVFHIRRIARDELNDYQLMEELCACDSVEKMREILLQCKQYQEDGSYQYDPEKELRAKRALEKRKHEEVSR